MQTQFSAVRTQNTFRTVQDAKLFRKGSEAVLVADRLIKDMVDVDDNPDFDWANHEKGLVILSGERFLEQETDAQLNYGEGRSTHLEAELRSSTGQLKTLRFRQEPDSDERRISYMDGEREYQVTHNPAQGTLAVL